MHDIGIEVLCLLGEKSFAEVPERLGLGLKYCYACFVDQSGGRVPWLDLLAEDDLQLIWVLLLENWEDIGIYCVELFLGEGTDVIQEELERVKCLWYSLGYELLPCEFGC